MTVAQHLRLSPADTPCPRHVVVRLGKRAPAHLHVLGNSELLRLPTIALFCSARCPGSALLAAYDQAARWRDEGRCVISGFHSPLEQECLRILLRGRQPMIICPARGLPRRLAPGLHAAFAAGRLLLITPFSDSTRRVTNALAALRNEFVAALADKVWFAHITPGGQMDRLAKLVAGWSELPNAPQHERARGKSSCV